MNEKRGRLSLMLISSTQIQMEPRATEITIAKVKFKSMTAENKISVEYK